MVQNPVRRAVRESGGARARAPTYIRGAAARLAAELELLGERGISARALGQCLMFPAERRGHRHDPACVALGVPMPRIARLLRASRHSGAASLLQDAVDAAVTELASWGAAWHPDGARDAWRAAIRERITPSVPDCPEVP